MEVEEFEKYFELKDGEYIARLPFLSTTLEETKAALDKMLEEQKPKERKLKVGAFYKVKLGCNKGLAVCKQDGTFDCIDCFGAELSLKIKPEHIGKRIKFKD